MPPPPVPPSTTPAIEKQLSNEYSSALETFQGPLKVKETSTRAFTTARVLTSNECYNIIKEKEMKRKAEEAQKHREKWKERMILIAKQKKTEEKSYKEIEKVQKARLAKEAGSKRETSNRRLTQLLTFQRHV